MAATSRAFVATLPELTDAQLERVFCWAQGSSEKADLYFSDGVLKLICLRKEQRSIRDYQRLLRTLLIKFKVPLPTKMTNWLSIVEEDEYDILRKPGVPANPDTQQSADEEGDTRVIHIEQETQYALVHLEKPDTEQAVDGTGKHGHASNPH